ncbi:MAG: Asp-tRNA(Asn)/Glu-tRNA(Gln) amidotransferase subunit GatC [Blastocatellia bacterium]|nr:Asp-tRNA(Asn)/Glu-tRNA(Gln) amidotransferase subunit GatC [Blastocatellia bacterium]MBK6428115.1 Asp-tRNA(Asn)/Glu-tRNA(Gln) amidotransferase subunit GatC [Blastocatellia bacterium]
MSITRDVVLKTATLAHLELSPDDADRFAAQMSEILSYMDQLGELDTTNVAPMSHSSIAEHVERTWRHDVVKPSLGTSVATANAPEGFHGYFKVPSVITRATGESQES